MIAQFVALEALFVFVFVPVVTLALFVVLVLLVPRHIFALALSQSNLDSSFLCVCVFCVCGVDRSSFVDSLQPVGGGWQTQKKRRWMAGQVQMEELLARAVNIDGRKEWCCGFSARRRKCGQGRHVEGVRQTFPQCCKVSTIRLFQPRLGVVVWTRPRQASARTKFWHTRPTGQKRQNNGSCAKMSRGSRKKEGHRRFDDAGEEGRKCSKCRPSKGSSMKAMRKQMS